MVGDGQVKAEVVVVEVSAVAVEESALLVVVVCVNKHGKSARAMQ